MSTTTDQTPAITIRRGDNRGTTALGWLHSRHSFSFGRYHDASNMGYQALRVINDDVVAPGQGFGEHGHDNMEILTWVLDGQLRHGDSLGHDQLLVPGELQRMSAGRGIRHSEANGSTRAPVHFLQIWIEPAVRDGEPAYGQQAFDAAGRRNRWQVLASGANHEGAMPIQQDAVVRVTDLDENATVTIDNADGRHAYVHVATGQVRIGFGGGDTTLAAGDAVTIDDARRIDVQAVAPSQVLWFDLA